MARLRRVRLGCGAFHALGEAGGLLATGPPLRKASGEVTPTDAAAAASSLTTMGAGFFRGEVVATGDGGGVSSRSIGWRRRVVGHGVHEARRRGVGRAGRRRQGLRDGRLRLLDRRLGVERDDLDGVVHVVVVRFLKGQELGVALQFSFVAFELVAHCQGFQSRGSLL